MKNFPPVTHCYIGRLPCGCCVASSYDIPECAGMVADMIKQGLTVERVPRGTVRVVWECVHQPKQIEMEVKS